jgi:hypothetical protein
LAPNSCWTAAKKRALNVLAGFTGVAELQKEAHLYAGCVQPSGGGVDVFDVRALLHSVENLLGAGLRADPHTLSTRATQGVDGVAFQDQVGTLETLEGQARVALLDEAGELLHPAWDQAEDVIHKPDVIRRVGVLEPGQLGDDVLSRAYVVALAPDGFRAPVAVIRATT